MMWFIFYLIINQQVVPSSLPSPVQITPTTNVVSTPSIRSSELIGVEAPIISEEYILMPGDNLLITIKGKVNYSYTTWVTYEGKIQIMLKSNISEKLETVDVIRISGLTIKEAQDSLTKIFLKYYNDVFVKLTLIGLRSGVVLVMGEVYYPGTYYAMPVERVSQIIAKAGGITPNGSRINIKLIRDRDTLKVDIEKFENEGEVTANPFVQSGDKIYVPPITNYVQVKGAIFGRGEYRLRTSVTTVERERISEGKYEMRENERLLDILKKAGGVTPWADLDNAYLERETPLASKIRIPLNLRKLLLENDLSYNLELKNGDIIYIPEIEENIYVNGEVVEPKAIKFQSNLTVSQYIAMAGGYTQYADRKKVYIIRKGKKITNLNNLHLVPGDIIYVPRIPLKFWEDYLHIFSTLFPIVLTILYATR
ncbi:MAG: SLBB domain-containing protein [candidate division WOR-3 bacterium]|nr:SLBB domain-containing protein [candidate division WOR-3 bacterium]MCX7836719.1 SLBB domain-containing protein [candidate division WOR-3 bacterium]MDW8113444.1 SLBB domain-containing protein [candidate division WOR-3 bacterium]